MHQSFKAWADEIPISEELEALEQSLSLGSLPGMETLGDSLSLSEWSPHAKTRIKTLADLDLDDAEDHPEPLAESDPIRESTGKVTDIQQAPSADKHEFSMPNLPARQASSVASMPHLPKGPPEAWNQGEWDHFVTDFIQKISTQVTAAVSASVAGEVAANVTASMQQTITEAVKASASANPISAQKQTVATSEEIEELLDENRSLAEEVRDLLEARGKLQILLDNRDAELSRYKHMFGAFYLKS
ncbi:MAG: hypothetical protein AB7P76_12915 [Candidatus Melainabacteria bacterium]